MVSESVTHGIGGVAFYQDISIITSYKKRRDICSCCVLLNRGRLLIPSSLQNLAVSLASKLIGNVTLACVLQYGLEEGKYQC